MNIIIKGNYSVEEAGDSLLDVLSIFKERYNIKEFREINLELTLVNYQGEDVELVDSETDEIYRVFEVYRSQEGVKLEETKPPRHLYLIVDNT